MFSNEKILSTATAYLVNVTGAGTGTGTAILNPTDFMSTVNSKDSTDVNVTVTNGVSYVVYAK